MIRNRRIQVIALAIALLVIVTGVEATLVQTTREVSASVNVQLMPDSGIEVYLDAELTQVADSVDFGILEVDVFGTVDTQVPVRVWIQNSSFSDVRLFLTDDYANGDTHASVAGTHAAPSDLHPGAGANRYAYFDKYASAANAYSDGDLAAIRRLEYLEIYWEMEGLEVIRRQWSNATGTESPGDSTVHEKTAEICRKRT